MFFKEELFSDTLNWIMSKTITTFELYVDSILYLIY